MRLTKALGAGKRRTEDSGESLLHSSSSSSSSSDNFDRFTSRNYGEIVVHCFKDLRFLLWEPRIVSLNRLGLFWTFSPCLKLTAPNKLTSNLSKWVIVKSQVHQELSNHFYFQENPFRRFPTFCSLSIEILCENKPTT